MEGRNHSLKDKNNYRKDFGFMRSFTPHVLIQNETLPFMYAKLSRQPMEREDIEKKQRTRE
jgi:hypothetical protein